MDHRGVDVAVDVFALGLFGKDHRHPEMARRHAGDGDARRLDGDDLVDAVAAEDAVELGADGVQQLHIQLMIQKAVHLQHIAGPDLTLAQDALLQQFHCAQYSPFPNDTETPTPAPCRAGRQPRRRYFYHYAKIRHVLQCFFSKSLGECRQFDNIL